MRTARLVLLVLAAFAAPAGAGDESVVHRGGQPDVFHVSTEDPRMNAAIAKARGTVDEFIGTFTNAGAHQRSFAVKVPVIEGSHIEHFWMDIERFANGQFTGRIANQPLDVHNIHFGDRIVVDKERISDWMYVDRGRLVGGFTIKALREEMSVEDRKAFDASLPFEIGD